MTRPPRAWDAVDGTIRIFLAEALVLPTSLVTTAYLTRMLGPAQFGLFSLAATLVVWLEWTTSSIFARATFKLIADAEEWRRTASAVVWLSGLTGVGVAVALWLVAVPVASWLHQPSLASYLRIFAIDIPIFALAQAHRNVLVGIGGFRQRAVVSAWRWTAKMIIVIALVAAGLSVRGAIIGSVGASVVELAVARWYVRPSVRRPPEYPMRRLWDYALPLFLASVAVRILDKLDLFMLTSLGGTAARAGEYGAAQNLSIVPGLLALSFSGILLATLSRARRVGDEPAARHAARNAMRLVVLLVPFGAMTAGAAPGIVVSIFGAAFAASAPLLALLINGALALLLVAVASSILTAAGRPRLVLAATAPLVPIAIAAHLLVIPRYGAIGAAAVTTSVTILGAVEAAWLVHRVEAALPPLASVVRSAGVAAGAYALAVVSRVSGPLIVVQLTGIMLAIVIAYRLLGELTRDELGVIGVALRGILPASRMREA